jgi:hypothetical protein
VFFDHGIQQPEEVIHPGGFAVVVKSAGTVRIVAVFEVDAVDHLLHRGQMKPDVANQVKIDLAGVDVALE